MPIIGQRTKPQTHNDVFNQFYENISPERLQKLNEIALIRNNLNNFVSRREQIDKIVELIDECDSFFFKGARNRKVSTHMPLFVIQWDWKDIEERTGYHSMKEKYLTISPDEWNYKSAKKFKKDEDFINKLLTKEVLQPYAEWMTDKLINMEIFKQFIEEQFKITLDDKDIEFIKTLTTLFCTIFHSHILLNVNTYHLTLQF